MCGGDEDPGGEDGGGAHEVRLARALAQEQRGQPREAAVLGLGQSQLSIATLGPIRGEYYLRRALAVLVSPDDATSAGALLRPGGRRSTTATTRQSIYILYTGFPS